MGRDTRYEACVETGGGDTTRRDDSGVMGHTVWREATDPLRACSARKGIFHFYLHRKGIFYFYLHLVIFSVDVDVEF